ncbi:MAG: FIST N-terminal domain-containing protein [Myxococcota bacterium]
MIAAVGLSQHTQPIRAAIEAARQAAALIPAPQRRMAIVFAAGAHASHPDEVIAAISEVTGLAGIFGGSGAGVLAASGEVEGDAVVVAIIGGRATIRMRLAAGLSQDSDATTSQAVRDLDVESDGIVLMAFDAMAFLPGALTAALRRQIPAGVPALGFGALERSGRPWVVAGDAPQSDAMAAMWMKDVRAHWVNAAVGAPLTPAMTVTRARGGVIEAIDEQRAYDVLVRAVKSPMMADLDQLGRLIFVGLPGPDETEVLRPLLGVDPYSGALAIGGAPVAAGQAIRFLLRSPQKARENLQQALQTLKEQLDQEPSLLIFLKGAGRGTELYGEMGGIETALVAAAFPDTPLIGVFSSCELAPSDVAPAVHLFSATLIALS